jgi:hypothetical protein
VYNVLVIVSQTLSRSVIINTNRHYDYDIFNRQINIHLEVRHKVIGIKRCHHGMSV